MILFLAANPPPEAARPPNADDVLSPFVWVFMAAYLVSLGFTPIMRAIASHYGIIDSPDGVRKMHKVPIAYLGGVAVFLGWLTGLTVSQFVPIYRVEDWMSPTLTIPFSIVIAACTIVFLGLWDDIFGVSPRLKILVQAMAASMLVFGEVGRRAAWSVLDPILHRTQYYFSWPDPAKFSQVAMYDHWLTLIISLIFVIALVVLCCNAANLLDGLDGLCGGVTGVVSAGFLFLAVNLAVSNLAGGATRVNQDALRVVIALALLGGVLGFVPFNFNPASIFMGDTGSMFLGFCCAVLIILFASEPAHFKWFIASIIMFSLPLMDTALAFTRRWVNGRPLFSADKFHLHHQLVARGFTIKRTVIISYGLSIMFCLLGAAVVYVRTRYALCIYLVVFGSLIVAAVKMGMVHERIKSVVRKPLNAGAEAARSEQAAPGAVLEVHDSNPRTTP